MIEEKTVKNFTKSYNTVTILEDKKILNTRKEIFELEKQLKIQKEEYDNLNSNWMQIANNLLENEYNDLNFLSNKLKIMISSKTNKLRSDVELRELYSLKADIKKIKIRINQQENLKEKIAKSKQVINFNIKQTETKISQLKEKQGEYINKLNIPSLSLKDKINKRLDLQQKFEEENLNLKTKEKILKNINFLNNEIEQQWKIESKKVTKIYEEILKIEDKFFFITTFVHANLSITEEIMHFHHFKNDENEVIKQLKQYENMNEYKNKISLIDNQNADINTVPIQNFLKQHNNLKLKPTKTENSLWITSVLLPTIALIIGIFHPPSLILSGIGLAFKTCTSLFSPSTKKVESWWYNKLFKNTEQKNKDKKEMESKIKDLTNSDLNTKLKAQYDILKQELNNRKDKKTNGLISDEIIIHNSNSILKESNIESKNNKDFDSSIRNIINHQNQPATSTGIHHSNLI